MATKLERWKQGRNAGELTDWLNRDVGDWFVNHVSSMDFVTASYIGMKQKAG
jgi:hemerythrin